jgi:hypothetical protein
MDIQPHCVCCVNPFYERMKQYQQLQFLSNRLLLPFELSSLQPVRIITSHNAIYVIKISDSYLAVER